MTDTAAHYMRLLLGGLLGLALLSVLFVSVAHAQNNTEDVATAELAEVDTEDDWFTVETIPSDGNVVVGDFVVGPGKVELEIAPGESKTIMMSVTNRIGERQRFNIETEDARGSNDPSKTVELLGGERGPYTLQDYISIPGTTLDLDHNKRARIPVTITVPADAEPGGRYGSVLVNTVAVKGEAGEDGVLLSQSPIIARIGTLFFITVPGEADRKGELKDFHTIPEKMWFESAPITFGLLYENTGSIHLAPYGTVSITNTLGDEVGYVELDPWFALPGALRFREVIWDTGFLFGRYTATAEINRGYNNVVDKETIVFWVLPWKVVASIFGGVFIALFLFRLLFKNFEFKRKV